MSTITKEWLQQKISDMEATRDEIPFGLDEDDSKTLAALRIALASIEAEPVAWAHRLINKRNGVVHPWVYGSAEASPSEGDIFNIEVMPLYTAPPAPVSVPDFGALTKCIVQRLVDYGAADDDAIASAEEFVYNACRAAMLQGADQPQSAQQNIQENIPTLREAVDTIRSSGIAIDGEKILAERDALNSPVIPDGWKMVPVEPTLDMVKAGAVAASTGMLIPGVYRAMLAAASPQQEVK